MGKVNIFNSEISTIITVSLNTILNFYTELFCYTFSKFTFNQKALKLIVLLTMSKKEPS